ncbi:MAG: class I poly(R)-hydroxyalkanoic acid synthase, partial [Pseudomonadota bacterium]|nr:class I poly(R)-hydroxyalkanoic acid synthase [Pseudomonadota bacterium]
WYLRNTYLENNLVKADRATVCDEPVDLASIDLPTYLYASREDHIVPWHGAYRSTQVLKGKQRFVLGASGHIAGVINPASKGKRSHWTNDAKPKAKAKALSADEWMAGATEHKGSWWTVWAAFLAENGGKDIKARSKLGNKQYAPIEPALGRYVKVRAD